MIPAGGSGREDKHHRSTARFQLRSEALDERVMKKIINIKHPKPTLDGRGRRWKEPSVQIAAARAGRKGDDRAINNIICNNAYKCFTDSGRLAGQRNRAPLTASKSSKLMTSAFTAFARRSFRRSSANHWAVPARSHTGEARSFRSGYKSVFHNHTCLRAIQHLNGEF